MQEDKNKCTIDVPSFPSANKVLPRAWGEVVKQMRHTVVHTDDCTDTGILCNLLQCMFECKVDYFGRREVDAL
jgi:hypothetical protein